MKYLTSSTTSIAVVIAVVLFTVATWLEGDPPPPEPVAPENTPTMSREVRPDTAVRDDRDSLSCRAAEEALRTRVEASQSCTVDEDCIIFDYGYPIQCLTSVAQREVTALRLEYRNYEQSCTHRVYYDCPSEPMERRPVCRNNRCVVELRTLDLLKDQTLEYLGIDPGESERTRPRSER